MIRAAVFRQAGEPLAIETLPDPEPGDGQVVVAVHRCGVCGSDLHMTEGHGYTVPAGTVLGHEFTGEVAAVGRGVDGLKVGDRVAAMPFSGCGQCAPCRAGDPACCADIGYLFGGYADHALVSARTAVRLPDSVSLADGALAEPLAVALHGLAMAGALRGQRLLVLGAGPIGLAALFWARRGGAGRIDMVERVPGRVEIARAMGADDVAPPADGADGFAAAADGYDLVVECVGRPGMLGQALARIRRRGTVLSLGSCFQPDTVTPAHAAAKEAKLLFPVLYTTAEFEAALDVLDGGEVGPRAMVTGTVPLDALPREFEALRRDPVHCKLLIDPAG